MNLTDNPFDKNAGEYDRWYDENSETLVLELSAVRFLMERAQTEYCVRTGKNRQDGLEVGVGSGRFAQALGIAAGIDPAPNMLDIASQRGIKVYQGVGEHLPFADKKFDYTAFFTSICFMEDPLRSFMEANRVTKAGGFLICSFLNRESPMGKVLAEHKKEDRYYSRAAFYSGAEVLALLTEAGFERFETQEAVFPGPPGEAIPHRAGLGEGLYGVILAWKK